MKITFENPDKVNGLMTLTVEETDYKDEVEKTLKDYRKKSNIPGFRPGMAPMSMLRKRFGAAVKVDAINKVLGENLQKYISDNNIAMLGEPLAHEGQEPVDLDQPAPYVFQFDIAVAPELNIELNSKDNIDYYDITVNDELIDQQVNMFASRYGHNAKADVFDPEQRDMLKGDLRELDADGNTLEGGLTIADATLMPQYMKVDDQKKLFDGAKPGDIITWNPRKAYPESDTEISALLKIEKDQVAEHTGDFSYQITEVSRFVNHEIDKELFENVYGTEAGIETEEQFRDTIAKGLAAQLQLDSDYKFLRDLRTYCEKKVGEIAYPDELLKRIMKKNNEDKGEDFVEKNFEMSIKELNWHRIKEQLAVANGIKIEENDVKTAAREAARAQFAQYGMSNVPDEYLDNYAQEMMKKRETVDGLVDQAIDRKLVAALKTVVKLDKKTVSIDEFNKLMAE